MQTRHSPISVGSQLSTAMKPMTREPRGCRTDANARSAMIPTRAACYNRAAPVLVSQEGCGWCRWGKSGVCAGCGGWGCPHRKEVRSGSSFASRPLDDTMNMPWAVPSGLSSSSSGWLPYRLLSVFIAPKSRFHSTTVWPSRGRNRPAAASVAVQNQCCCRRTRGGGGLCRG